MEDGVVVSYTDETYGASAIECVYVNRGLKLTNPVVFEPPTLCFDSSCPSTHVLSCAEGTIGLTWDTRRIVFDPEREFQHLNFVWASKRGKPCKAIYHCLVVSTELPIEHVEFQGKNSEWRIQSPFGIVRSEDWDQGPCKYGFTFSMNEYLRRLMNVPESERTIECIRHVWGYRNYIGHPVATHDFEPSVLRAWIAAHNALTDDEKAQIGIQPALKGSRTDGNCVINQSNSA